jgi:hypothetical protein
MARGETGQKPRVTIATVKRVRLSPIREPIEREAYTIPQFCSAHAISVDTYYRMARAGIGPEVMKIGHSTRINVEAAAKWREARTAAAREQRHGRETVNTTA